MFVLGIESTAHTFGVGIAKDEYPFILANERDTYVPKEGGMRPTDLLAHHASVAPDIIRRALNKAKLRIDDIDYIAFSMGPGIGPALRVGATVARALSLKYGKPLVPVNHGIGHIEIGYLTTNAKDPLVLYLSGGNTQIITLYKGKFRVFGETLDIALGNLMDTFSRDAGLAPPYVTSGKHVIDICADKGDKLIDLPYVVKGQDISYSGLLTASEKALKENKKEDVCLSLREIAFDMLLEATERALALTGKKEILAVGGVAASVSLKSKLDALSRDWGVELKIVPPEYSGDNGAMIAYAGTLEARSGITISVDKSQVKPRWRVDEVDVKWRS
ncbi:KEOPS complex N(6)-L-threonylcarbamoyladenine synthase Kae1 [Sulfuracidifex metallicus]|jgi:N6-L-threonylcarbamoyladenine synthase|uniref:tRNA N6-adenosine threonylcarbamoyltransferase n=1 Tax=Sulfuracidifex metallicus DSM 6482 = JCM 9184 TaxID=523847 RepID=A0A6A9QH29_SULME|nr:KEOPS complex N(6)-L-threonylcarbamoyladenine synthase Kae1 [Sulfuracidifex metallicus]MUN28316.1 N(6)-L-threonylcarbamoyladenine synthase Kae1 [Sulfuracidifex metallicus DSM 6482 = JCM 9184]WOE51154.1 KEOPS complex N(6)-L-threonylcarbamoyladenine synthase Kae1 [Sulfuracidifex metallicus DSM 6482 = JCM 9184]